MTKVGQIVAELIGSDTTRQEVERVRSALRAIAERLPADLHAVEFRKELAGAAACNERQSDER